MPVNIRRASSEELPVIAELVRLGAKTSFTDEVIGHALSWLDGDRCVVWVAESKDGIIGMTALQLRDMRVGSATLRAGYWTNLVVRPEHRQTSAYPALVRRMIRDAPALGLAFIYGGIRRPIVVDGHVALGFERLGDIPVLVRPIRPFRAVVRRNALPAWLGTASALPDAVWRIWLAFRHRRTHRRVANTNQPDLSAIGALRTVVSISDPAGVRWTWGNMLVHDRFGHSADGGEYHWVCVGDSGSPEAAVVFRVATRASGLRLGVIVSVMSRVDAGGALVDCLDAAERRLDQMGADLIIALPGWSPQAPSLLRARGYFSSREQYVVLWKPFGELASSPMTPVDRWRFEFADHDAF